MNKTKVGAKWGGGRIGRRKEKKQQCWIIAANTADMRLNTIR